MCFGCDRMGDFERSGRLGVKGGGSTRSFSGCAACSRMGVVLVDDSSATLRSTLSSALGVTTSSEDFLSLMRSSTRLLGEVGLGGTLSFGESCGSVGEQRSITVVCGTVVVAAAATTVGDLSAVMAGAGTGTVGKAVVVVLTLRPTGTSFGGSLLDTNGVVLGDRYLGRCMNEDMVCEPAFAVVVIGAMAFGITEGLGIEVGMLMVGTVCMESGTACALLRTLVC